MAVRVIRSSISTSGIPYAYDFDLKAYPNPFNARVVLALSGIENKSTLAIHDISGRLIKTIPELHNGVVWDGTNNQGQIVASGVYFARATLGEKAASVKLTSLK